jgi:hypothetical protein
MTPRDVTNQLIIALREAEKLTGWNGFWFRFRHPILSKDIDNKISSAFRLATELYDVWMWFPGETTKEDREEVKKYTDQLHRLRKTIW